MRHRKTGLKLSRTSSHRNAMFRNMVTSLLKHDRIRTTGPKAKEVRRWADHLITLAKRGDLHARRQALSIVMEKDVVHKLFDQAAERFGNIAGGYTRVVKLGTRPGDSAPISMVELVAAPDAPKKKTKKKTAKTAGTKAKAPKAVKKKADAPDAGDAAPTKAKAKPASKKKAAVAEKKEAPAAKDAADQKAAPEKEAAADPKDASDSSGPAESAEKSAEDK